MTLGPTFELPQILRYSSVTWHRMLLVETLGVGGKPPKGEGTWGIWLGIEKNLRGGKTGIAFSFIGGNLEAS